MIFTFLNTHKFAILFCKEKDYAVKRASCIEYIPNISTDTCTRAKEVFQQKLAAYLWANIVADPTIGKEHCQLEDNIITKQSSLKTVFHNRNKE